LETAVHLPWLVSAVQKVVPRFPFFQVEIRTGMFWYALVRRHDLPALEADVANPCMNPQLIGKKRWPFRLRVHGRTISGEFSHMLTDGIGALTFMRTLASEYATLAGFKTEAIHDLPVDGHPWIPQEWEDQSPQLALERPPKRALPEQAFHVPYKLASKGYYQYIHGFCDCQAVLALAKADGLSLTEYLASVLLYSYQQLLDVLVKQKQRITLRPLRLLVPVNLRTLFQSRTLRNFFAFSYPAIDPRLGDFSFEQICILVHHTMQAHVQAPNLLHQLSMNVAEERPLWKRITPLFIKNLVIAAVYALSGDRRYTCSYSNLGKVIMPLGQEALIQSWSFLPPPSPVCKINMTSISWKNELCISFGSMVEETELQRLFFEFLASRGVAVRVVSNQQMLEDYHEW